MSKIRINELARELEVKPNRILELLPEFGVDEKKTHSSSIDEDVAIAIKNKLGVDSEPDQASRSSRSSYAAVAVADDEPEETQDDVRPEAPAPELHVPEHTVSPQNVARPKSPAEEPPPAPPEPEAVRPMVSASRPAPLRPPLASGPVRPLTAPPAVPPPPRVGPESPSPAPRQSAQPAPSPQSPAQQQSRPGSVPGQPVPPPARPQGPGTPQQAQPLSGQGPGRPVLPARDVPIFTPKPGQVVSGPRQPLPPELSNRPLEPRPAVTPGAPRPAPSPGAPRPPVSRPPVQGQRPQGQQPGGPRLAGPVLPGQRPPIAGQPAARPVVPPNPELLARIQQSRPGPPPAPGQPRPQRPNQPRPGEPIFRGPLRPGQPMRPGGPTPGAPSPGSPQMRGGRPMRHPTSPLGRIEPAPPPVEPGRRHQGKPRPAGDIDRKRDMEGKLDGKFRPSPQRREPVAPPPIDREITIGEGITVKELSEKLGVKSSLVIKKLVDRKIFATINQSLDVKLAQELSRDFGAATNTLSFEEEATWEVEMAEEAKDLLPRPPVVTIMGHVDHGKTSLLDKIRSTRVADREAGGITQHIGASQVTHNGKKIVFIDTPGHEAFTRMRARGAQVTDIVILVVAADDGVMPQTLEAIDHAKAAKVPIIVAINKIDKVDSQIDRIKQQLSDRGLLAEDWGGDVVMVPVSAKTGQNLELLLEMILLVTEIANLKSNPSRPGIGTVLEAQLDRGRGPVATVLVQNGTLRVGDFFICGQVFGKVRAMYDHLGQQVREAEPSTAVEVIGLDALPDVGDNFQVVTDTGKAKQIVVYRESKSREQAMSKSNRITLEQLSRSAKEGDQKELNVIIKTDVGGTAEVLSEMLQKLSTEKVKIRVVAKNVGAITESDVLLASASEAIIIGFNVRPERNAAALAEKESVDLRLHTIIYELTDEIKKAMTGLLDPTFKEVFKGRAEVREVFRISKVGIVAGCYVTEGTLSRGNLLRLTRDNIVIHTGRIDTLKRFKEDVTEVKTGFECGVTIANHSDVKQGDIIEAFVNEKVAPQLS
jgi:translation initiation factor IF-2